MAKSVDDWVIVIIILLAALLIANLFVSGTIFRSIAAASLENSHSPFIVPPSAGVSIARTLGGRTGTTQCPLIIAEGRACVGGSVCSCEVEFPQWREIPPSCPSYCDEIPVNSQSDACVYADNIAEAVINFPDACGPGCRLGLNTFPGECEQDPNDSNCWTVKNGNQCIPI
jgi:hypothetical protein